MLILDQFKSIKDSLTGNIQLIFSSLTIQDTTPYRYYVNSMMPFVRMDLKEINDLEQRLHYILGIHSCFNGGWLEPQEDWHFYPADSLDLKYFHEPKYIK
ncbi:MAG: hypothetical protein IPH93_12120 [Saprospiraceae bacterium]|nr:hypothetical protein [Saprospiraceae bacterium]